MHLLSNLSIGWQILILSLLIVAVVALANLNAMRGRKHDDDWVE